MISQARRRVHPRDTGFQPVLSAYPNGNCSIERNLHSSVSTHGLKTRVTIALLVLLTLPTLAVADSSIPHTALGNEPIRSTTSQPPASGPAAAAPMAPSMEYARVLGALGVVIGLIFAFRWGARFFFPSVAGRSSNRIVQVLARSALTPKQQVILLRVGRRIIVVGDSGVQMNTLCEIAEPDEVASLVGQLNQDRIASGSGFGSLFGRFRGRFEGAEEPEAPPLRNAEEDVPPASAQSELDGLRDRVRRLAEQFQ